MLPQKYLWGTMVVSACGGDSKLFRSCSAKISLFTQSGNLGSHLGFYMRGWVTVVSQEKLPHWHGPRVLLRNNRATTLAAVDSLFAALTCCFSKLICFQFIFVFRFYYHIKLQTSEAAWIYWEDITEWISRDIITPKHCSAIINWIVHINQRGYDFAGEPGGVAVRFSCVVLSSF